MVDRMRSILLLAAIALTLMLASCSGGAISSIQPDSAQVGRIPAENGHVVWGTFTLAFNPDEGSVLVLPNRGLEKHYNVTQSVRPPACNDCVDIISSMYDPPAEEWTVGLRLDNSTALTGYDVRCLVYALGDKWLKNPDGFMNTYLSQDLSFMAFNRADSGRAFGPHTNAQASFLFHFPAGNNWATADYIIDASWPGNCEEPLVEDISFQALIENGQVDSPLTVKAFDHQGDSFIVRADLSPIGGNANTPLYDDGLHSDGSAGDGTYGADDITVNAPAGDYVFRIAGIDDQSYYGWNSWHVTLTGTPNQYPVIDQMTISRTTCLKNSTTEKVGVNCIAHDPESGPLTYHWSAPSGTFDNPNVQATQWKSPNAVGTVELTCTVTDNLGGQDEGQSPEIHVTQYASLGAGPDFNCVRALATTYFKLTDYCPDKVVLLHFWTSW